MGQFVDGIWQEGGDDTLSSGGRFVRSGSAFRNWVTPDGRPGPTGEGGFPAEGGRYHLYVSYACPWAQRTLILRALRGLAPHIGLSVVHPDMGAEGWSFATGFPGTTGDLANGAAYLRELYLRARPGLSGRVTVPVLWDRARGTIVSNESSEILRMFDTAFDALTGNRATLRPADLAGEIDALNDRIYETVNDGVYRAGFATTQEAYDEAAAALFATLEALEARLAGRRYLTGPRLTEADWRLFPTLLRFDAVYAVHFKCTRRRIADFPNLAGYARELFQVPGVAGTVRFDHILRHYYRSHRGLNPHGIVPPAPAFDWTAAHGRGRLPAA